MQFWVLKIFCLCFFWDSDRILRFGVKGWSTNIVKNPGPHRSTQRAWVKIWMQQAWQRVYGKLIWLINFDWMRFGLMLHISVKIGVFWGFRGIWLVSKNNFDHNIHCNASRDRNYEHGTVSTANHIFSPAPRSDSKVECMYNDGR